MRLALLGTLILIHPTWGAEDCGKCKSLAQQIEALSLEKREQTYLLEKNKLYLASLGESEKSKRIKANSNIFWITHNLEDLESSSKELEQEASEKDCSQCK